MAAIDEQTGRQLSAYLDGELSRKEARHVEEAVAASAELRAELESLRAVRAALRGLPRAPAPAGLSQRVLARAERAWLLGDAGPAAGRPAWWWIGRAAAAAVILVAVGVGILVVSDIGPGPQLTDLAVEAPPAPSVPEDTARTRPGKDAAVAGAPLGTGTEAVGDEVVFFMNVPRSRLAMVNNDVQRVLEDTGAREVTGEAPAPAPAKVLAGRANFYSQNQLRKHQFEYVVVMTEPQLRRICSELNEMRGAQGVAQVPLRDMPGLAKGDAGEVALAMAEHRRGPAKAAPAEGAARRTEGRLERPARRPAPPAAPRPDEPQAETAGEPAPRAAGPAGTETAEAEKDQTDEKSPDVTPATPAPATSPAASTPTPAPARSVPTAVAADDEPDRPKRAKVVATALTQEAPCAIPPDAMTQPAWQVAARQQAGVLAGANVRQLRIVLNGVAEPNETMDLKTAPPVKE